MPLCVYPYICIDSFLQVIWMGFMTQVAKSVRMKGRTVWLGQVIVKVLDFALGGRFDS